jgi:hypothetical protein
MRSPACRAGYAPRRPLVRGRASLARRQRARVFGHSRRIAAMSASSYTLARPAARACPFVATATPARARTLHPDIAFHIIRVPHLAPRRSPAPPPSIALKAPGARCGHRQTAPLGPGWIVTRGAEPSLCGCARTCSGRGSTTAVGPFSEAGGEGTEGRQLITIPRCRRRR